MKQLHLIEEIETALASGDAKQRQITLKRIADYFVSGSRSYSGEQIELFDDIFLKLAADIEVKALAKCPIASHRSRTPPRMVRSLAFNDAIDVAAPVSCCRRLVSESSPMPRPRARRICLRSRNAELDSRHRRASIAGTAASGVRLREPTARAFRI